MLKRMKWINSFLLLFALFSFLSTMAYADNSIGWEVNEEGVLTITGEGVIPPSYHPWENDYTLMDKVTSIIISEGINTIGKSTFGSNFFTRVNTVHFPTTLEKIAASNFTWLNNLKRVDLPEGLIEIGDNCFTGCSYLSSVRLPSSLTSIGMRCFNGSGIVSITVPASVTYIGQGAFSQSKALQSIKVEENNPNYIDRNGVLYSKSNSFILCCYPAGKPEITFTVPSDVSAIGESAFSGNKSLETVNISSNVISMGTDSFFSCYALKRVDIPESINVIPSGAFCNCKLLTTVSIPESVTSIRSRAFYGCTSLNSIEIPDSVKYIGNSPNFSSSSPVVFPVETTIICTKGSVADDYARAYGNHVIYTDACQSGEGARLFQAEPGYTVYKIPRGAGSFQEEGLAGCNGNGPVCCVFGIGEPYQRR